MFVIVVTAGTASFGEDIKIAGLLRETIKYLWLCCRRDSLQGFCTGVGTLPPPPSSVAIALGVVSLLIWYLQRSYFLPPDKSYLAVSNYSNACLGLSVLAMYLLRDRLTRPVLLVVAGYQVCVLVGCLLVKTTSMSMAALLIFLVTLWAALNLDRQRRTFLRLLLLFAGGAVVGFYVFVWNTPFFDTIISTNFGLGIAVRLTLWEEAGALILSHFPYGIGPGQFGELGLRESDLWSSLNEGTLVMLGLDPSEPLSAGFDQICAQYVPLNDLGMGHYVVCFNCSPYHLNHWRDESTNPGSGNLLWNLSCADTVVARRSRVSRQLLALGIWRHGIHRRCEDSFQGERVNTLFVGIGGLNTSTFAIARRLAFSLCWRHQDTVSLNPSRAPRGSPTPRIAEIFRRPRAVRRPLNFQAGAASRRSRLVYSFRRYRRSTSRLRRS